MTSVSYASRLFVRHRLAKGLSVALLLAAPAAALPSAMQVLRPGADQGKGWCFETTTASVRDLEIISAEVQRYIARVVSVAVQEEEKATASLDEARRVARQAAQVLSERQRELARLEAARREGAGAAPDARLLEAEAALDKAEKALAFHRGLVDRASRLRQEYERISASSDSDSERRKRELDREIAVAGQAVVANVQAPRPDF